MAGAGKIANEGLACCPCRSPRVSATKLRGPEPGITYSEATEAPVHGVAASAEAAPVPTAHRPPESLKAATDSCLRRDEEDALGAMQVRRERVID